ncbi:MAG: hypothetical protein IJ306_07575 [Oscillospiraceae bacterium]|nr:hypothetical protein [Oscillospiraceae bacterium]
MLKKIAFLIFFLLVFSSCTAANESAVYEYTAGYTTITEPCGKVFLFKTNYDETAAGENIYRFSPEIPLEERADFIRKQEELVSAAEKLFGTEISGYTFYIFEEYPVRSDSENKSAFFGMNEAATYKQALGTVLAVLGDFTNYGYAYALADNLAAKLGWEQDTPAAADISVFAAEPAMLNLNYACFSELSSDPNEIGAAKALSLEIFAELKNPFGGEAEFIAAATEKAVEFGIEDFEPSHIRFAYAGESCPMRMRTKYLDIMRESSYIEDVYVKDGYTDEEWTATVSTLLEKLGEIDTELSRIRALFKIEDEKLVPTYLKDEISYTADGTELWGLFRPTKLDLQVRGAEIIVHEYVHYLFQMCADYDGNFGIDNGTNPYLEAWHGESIAYYFGAKQAYDQYVFHFGGGAFNRYEEVVGHPLEKYTDMAEYYDAMFHANYRLDPKQTPKSFTNDRDADTISFGGYVARTYGEQTFVDIMLHPSKCPELTGKTFPQIEDDWEEYIMHGVILGEEFEAEIQAEIEKQQ